MIAPGLSLQWTRLTSECRLVEECLTPGVTAHSPARQAAGVTDCWQQHSRLPLLSSLHTSCGAQARALRHRLTSGHSGLTAHARSFGRQRHLRRNGEWRGVHAAFRARRRRIRRMQYRGPRPTLVHDRLARQLGQLHMRLAGYAAPAAAKNIVEVAACAAPAGALSDDAESTARSARGAVLWLEHGRRVSESALWRISRESYSDRGCVLVPAVPAWCSCGCVHAPAIPMLLIRLRSPVTRMVRDWRP